MEKHNVSIFSSYTFLNQYATVTNRQPSTAVSGYNRHDQLSGRCDFLAAWAFAHQQRDESSINILVHSGTNIGQSQQFNLSDNLGSQLGTNSIQGGTPHEQNPIMINLLYYQQSSWNKNINLYLGKLHPNQHIDLSTVADDETKQFIGGTVRRKCPRSTQWHLVGPRGGAGDCNAQPFLYACSVCECGWTAGYRPAVDRGCEAASSSEARLHGARASLIPVPGQRPGREATRLCR